MKGKRRRGKENCKGRGGGKIYKGQEMKSQKRNKERGEEEKKYIDRERERERESNKTGDIKGER